MRRCSTIRQRFWTTLIPALASRLPGLPPSKATSSAEFIAAIREDRAPSPDGWDGYRATEIAFAAYQSVETGQPVRLPLEV
jgi:predicted dehydrogenase